LLTSALLALVLTQGVQYRGGSSDMSPMTPSLKEGASSAAVLDIMPLSSMGCSGQTSISGTALTFSRASSGADLYSGSESSCSNNVPRTMEDGLIIEDAVTQAYPTPDAPAGATTGSLATGWWTFWVEGTGSQQISAGTATGSGLPCTATASNICYTSISVAGTLVLSAVTGSLSFAQLEHSNENSPIKTSRIHSPGTRSADIAEWIGPRWTNKKDWIIEAEVTPRSGHSWAYPGNATIVQGGPYGGANSIDFYVLNGIPICSVWDAAGNSRYVQGDALTNNYHRLTCVACSADRSVCPHFYVDGVSNAHITAGVGTGILSSIPTSLRIGSCQGGQNFGQLTIRNIRVASGTSDPRRIPSANRTRYGTNSDYISYGYFNNAHRVAALGDSITAADYGGGITTSYEAQLVSQKPLYMVPNFGIGSTQTADHLQRYMTDVRFRGYGYVAYLGGINDVNLNSGAAQAISNITQLYAAIKANGGKVLAMTLLPGGQAPGSQRRTDLEAINTAIRNAASADPTNIILVDTNTDFDNGSGAMKAIWDVDGGSLHPNDAGLTEIATLLASHLP